ncbi:sensor histidine kinase [Oceanospirillum sediminis]|uniref:histidine kinase n=1 Tax=Oceanospirillum sediminis TaxID=2760088 RepID=A0A839IQ77_9GAMM|nr:ATP-binding protein [Oceanospirillum sediminis]MBB1486639.1 hypothetical protein [Oceanospirillum sediminis]
MPDKRRQKLMKEKVHLSNRRQVIIAVSCFLLLSLTLAELEAFEVVYYFSRTHEDWELDELILGALAALITTAFTFAYSTWRYNRVLNEEIEYRVKLEQELAQAQKMQSLATLAGGVAHSTNNYLQPILTLSRLTKKQLPEDSPVQGIMDKILLAAENAREVLAQLLRFSHSDNREMSHCDLLHELSKHQLLYRSVLSEPDLLVFELTDQPCRVGLSTSEVSDILLALITNAEDSYPQQMGEITVTLSADRDRVILQVTDQGCGMDLALQARIFDPFFTSKDVGQGTGLGLSIVHGLVEQQGGSIEVESAPDQGSCFTVILPSVPDEQPDDK